MGQRVYDITSLPDDGLPLRYPAIEELPEFLCVVPDKALLPACRNYNASICRIPGGEWLMAYRHEPWNAMNRIAIARLGTDLTPVANSLVKFPDEGVRGVHWEDPRLAVVDGHLLLMSAWVKFGTPSICRQRLWEIDPASLQPVDEIILPYGRSSEGVAEKNWMPFGLPGGGLAIVYQQRPHSVIEHPSSIGHTTPGLVGWTVPGKFFAGRTPPLLLPSGRWYLAFFGGHVKHEYRAARYFMAAHLFEAAAPYRIVQATKEPLAWASECSPTFLSSRPASGHPICLYPSGAALFGDRVIVSCGVNDSYNVLLQYDLTDLLGRMSPVDEAGNWQEEAK